MGLPLLLIKDGEDEYQEVHVVLDPDCKGNWISPKIVKRLSLQDKVRDCQIVQTRCVTCGELTGTQKVRLEWKPNKSLQRPRVDEFFIFQEIIEVEAILGNDIVKREPNPQFRRDHKDGNDGSGRINRNRGTAKAPQPTDSADGGSSSNWPPRSNLNYSKKQVCSLFLLPWRLIADPIVDEKNFHSD
jgi:hypothetical protein